MNKYQEIELFGANLEEVVIKLLNANKNGNFMSANFNGTMLYSDKVTMDSAYSKIVGKTKDEHDKYLEEESNKYKEHKKEHKNNIPSLSKSYIESARGVILEDKLEYWDRIVPIRLSDLYEGMELKCTLDIAKILNDENNSFEDAKEELDNQKHSGMSYSLVKAMVMEFCKDGIEFVAYLDITSL